MWHCVITERLGLTQVTQGLDDNYGQLKAGSRDGIHGISAGFSMRPPHKTVQLMLTNLCDSLRGQTKRMVISQNMDRQHPTHILPG